MGCGGGVISRRGPGEGSLPGIQFITDEKGRRRAAIIDLSKHKALWEDIEDVLVSRSRRHEKRIPWEKVKGVARTCSLEGPRFVRALERRAADLGVQVCATHYPPGRAAVRGYTAPRCAL